MLCNLIAESVYLVEQNKLYQEVFFKVNHETGVYTPILTVNKKSSAKVGNFLKATSFFFDIKNTLDNYNPDNSSVKTNSLINNRTIKEANMNSFIIPIMTFEDFEKPIVKNNQLVSDDYYGIVFRTNFHPNDILIKVSLEFSSIQIENDTVNYQLSISETHPFIFDKSFNKFIKLDREITKINQKREFDTLMENVKEKDLYDLIQNVLLAYQTRIVFESKD